MVDWVTTLPANRAGSIDDRATADRSAETAPIAARRGRSVTVPRIPIQVVALVGLTTGGYATALAGVTALQSSAEAATAAARAPLGGAIRDAASRNDALAAHLAEAASRGRAAASGYTALIDGIGAAESALGKLSSSVTAVDGASRALPTRVALPATVRTVVRVSSSGTAHATTGGSGAP